MAISVGSLISASDLASGAKGVSITKSTPQKDNTNSEDEQIINEEEKK